MPRYVENNQQELVKRIICCKFSRQQASQMVSRLLFWERHHGIKWVVSRLKSFQQSLLGKETPELRKHRDGTFYGDFRPLSRHARQSRKGLVNSLRVCRLYGLFEAKPPGPKEYRAFGDLIKQKTDHKLIVPLSITPEDMWLAAQAQKACGFSTHYPSDNTRAPTCKLTTKPTRDFTFLDHGLTFARYPNLVYSHYEFFERLFRIHSIDFFERRISERDTDIVGKVVGLTKDRGMKVRFIANPFRTLQTALSRLKNATELLLRDLPESAVFDQERGVQWVAKKLEQGHKVSSIDLSSCTDFLPLAYQLDLLNTLFPLLKEDISIFESISRSYWFTPSGEEVKWETGQPLGTGPSFSAFTLFHLFLVRSIGGDASNFRIIGDDIVMSSSPLVRRYLKVMEGLKVPISHQKSLFDSGVAEFAGRVIDRFGKMPVYKASPTDLVNDPLGVIRQYGSRGLDLVPKNLRAMIKTVSTLPNPFGFELNREDLNDIPPEVFYHLFSEKLPLLATSFRRTFEEGLLVLKVKDGCTATGIPEWVVKMAFPPRPQPGVEEEVRYYDQGPVIGQGIWSIHLVNDQQIVDHYNANVIDVPAMEVPDKVKNLAKGQVLMTVKPFSEPEPKLSFVRKVHKLMRNISTKT
jgi:hypothetical protein